MKVLLVEDNKIISKNLQRGLTQEMMAVDVAYDGLGAIDMASDSSYDVMVLDWMLPEMSGMEVLDKLRSTGFSIPVLMLTAKDELVDKIEGFSHGADDYLTKPFEFDELVARIRALSRRPRKVVGDKIDIGEIEIDLPRFEVRINEEVVDLSRREFMLLKYLAKNKNRIFSKEQIIESVWGFDADVLPNTVEVVVANLRKKIDPLINSPNTFIKTERGFGYRLLEQEDV